MADIVGRRGMELTSVVVAQSKSKSLRTTIPAGIARQFGINDETQLAWEIEARDNELRIVVRPLKPSVAGQKDSTDRSRSRTKGPAP